MTSWVSCSLGHQKKKKRERKGKERKQERKRKERKSEYQVPSEQLLDFLCLGVRHFSDSNLSKKTVDAFNF